MNDEEQRFIVDEEQRLRDEEGTQIYSLTFLGDYLPHVAFWLPRKMIHLLFVSFLFQLHLFHLNFHFVWISDVPTVTQGPGGGEYIDYLQKISTFTRAIKVRIK